MVDDPYFWPAVRNTVLLIVVLIPLQFALALTMALLLRARPRLSGLYFYLWAVPLAFSDLAAGLVWLAIFTDRGYLNSVLDHLDLARRLVAVVREPRRRCSSRCSSPSCGGRPSLVFVILVAGPAGHPEGLRRGGRGLRARATGSGCGT